MAANFAFKSNGKVIQNRGESKEGYERTKNAGAIFTTPALSASQTQTKGHFLRGDCAARPLAFFTDS
jgi:hypothetical protein